MTFLEALEKLKNGECEGISPIHKGIGEASYYLILDESGGLTYCNYHKGIKLHPKTYLGEWILHNPKPVYKEKEIELWYDPKTGFVSPISTNSNYIRMKGIQKVEIKQPVKKTYKFPLSQTTCVPSGRNSYEIGGTAEIEPDKDKIVKNMTLTINWEEHEKEEVPTEVQSSELPIDKSAIQTIIDDIHKGGFIYKTLKNSEFGKFGGNS